MRNRPRCSRCVPRIGEDGCQAPYGRKTGYFKGRSVGLALVGPVRFCFGFEAAMCQVKSMIRHAVLCKLSQFFQCKAIERESYIWRMRPLCEVLVRLAGNPLRRLSARAEDNSHRMLLACDSACHGVLVRVLGMRGLHKEKRAAAEADCAGRLLMNLIKYLGPVRVVNMDVDSTSSMRVHGNQ